MLTKRGREAFNKEHELDTPIPLDEIDMDVMDELCARMEALMPPLYIVGSWNDDASEPEDEDDEDGSESEPDPDAGME